MFSLLSKAFQFIMEAVIVYAASDKGATELRGILDEAEADGINIPFYEPTQPMDGAGQDGVDNSQVNDTTFVQSTQPARVIPKVRQ